MSSADQATQAWDVVMLDETTSASIEDVVAVEEPLELAVAIGDEDPRSAFVTLRTPGQDHHLALGWLLGEGVIVDPAAVASITAEIDPARPLHQRIVIRLHEAHDLGPLDRVGWSSSACGVCGRTAVNEVLGAARSPPTVGLPLPRETLFALPNALRQAQGVFDATGGIHAAGLFDLTGTLLALAEDIGRHNAVDKVIGMHAAALEGVAVLMTSGRAGFEIVAKAARCGIPILAAVGAPTSLSVRVANAAGLTLVGFLRDRRANIYTHPRRIAR